MRGWAALALVALALPLGAEAPVEAPIKVERPEIVQRFPHDPGAFTQGLFIDGGELFESTGQVGRSSIRKVDLVSGKVLKRVNVPPPYFGEGIAPWKGQILSLTWQQGKGFRWDRKRLKQVGSFAYSGEGWGLTNDGKQLILSDGSDTLRFIEPGTFKVTRSLKVTFKGRPLRQLNELEWIKGEIFANVWMSNYAVRIDPASGKVVGLIDLSGLLADSMVRGHDQVPNGIAWDARTDKLYLTGKEWPWLYEVRLEPLGVVN